MKKVGIEAEIMIIIIDNARYQYVETWLIFFNNVVLYYHVHVIMVNINHRVLKKRYRDIRIQIFLSQYHHWLTATFLISYLSLLIFNQDIITSNAFFFILQLASTCTEFRVWRLLVLFIQLKDMLGVLFFVSIMKVICVIMLSQEEEYQRLDQIMIHSSFNHVNCQEYQDMIQE